MSVAGKIGYVTFSFCFIFLLTSCHSSQHKHGRNAKEENVTADTTVEDDTLFTSIIQQEGKFSDWRNIYAEKGVALSIDSFSYSGEYTNDMQVTDMLLDKNFYKRYGRFIVYNIDSSKFIDPFSYLVDIVVAKNGKLKSLGTEADQEVAVVDVKKQKRYRIFFCGTSCFVAKTAWLNNGNVALFGITMEEETDSTVPTIWLVNISNNVVTEYSYTTHVGSITPDDILDNILTAKGIAVR